MEKIPPVLIGMVATLLVLSGVLLYQYRHLQQANNPLLCLQQDNCSQDTTPAGSCAPGRSCTN